CYIDNMSTRTAESTVRLCQSVDDHGKPCEYSPLPGRQFCRYHLPVTDSAVATAMGVHKAAVSRIVNGTRRPGVEFMTKAEKALGWSMRAQHLALADGKYAQRLRLHIRQWKPPRPVPPVED